MRIYTGRAGLMEPALIEIMRASMAKDVDAHIVVVPKQLTLQTERTLLRALELVGSFQLQVCSPERLCQRIFEAAGQPDGVRIDARGRVMLARTAVREAGERLRLYKGAEVRRGFASRCARQLELLRQAGLTPAALSQCASEAQGLLALKLGDLSEILSTYERLLSGRFQDGESEFNDAVARAGEAAFLKRADVTFFGFDLTPPTLHSLIAAVGAVCPDVRVLMPLENDREARDFDAFLPMQHSFERLVKLCERAGAQPERICVASDASADLRVSAPKQRGELKRLASELFAFPAQPDTSDAPPKCVQVAVMRNPMEECRFAAALCRRMARQRGWHWNDMLILCRDIENYHPQLKAAFHACGVPIFLSSRRPAARHALAECLLSALKLLGGRPDLEDALSLMRTGFMPITEDEAARLANHIHKYGLRPRAILSPLKRGTEAEQTALEPVRQRFAEPLNTLRGRLRRSKSLKEQLTALFNFFEDIEAVEHLNARLNALCAAGLREQAGEEGQVWNRIVGALDQMAALMGEDALKIEELRQTLSESLEAAEIKPLPQADDAVFAQTTERIVAQRAKLIILLGETDRAGGDADGLLNTQQLQAVSRLTRAYLGSDDAELSRMRRFYLKSAMEMTSDYLCVTYPLSGMDNAAQRPGALVSMIQALFPKLTLRGGVSGDVPLEAMLRASPEGAASHVAQALSGLSEGADMTGIDAAAFIALNGLAREEPSAARALQRMQVALNHAESAERLDPKTARALYGSLRRQSISRLERFAQCPFAYFTQYGLRPERIEPFVLSAQDEGTFYHEAVRAFMQASRDDLNAIDAEEAGRRMDGIADQLLNQMAESGPLGDSATSMAERRRLKATARTVAGVLAEHMRGSQFKPTALEEDFGVEDSAARLTLNAATGACTLEGRIDRVDEWLEGGYLRVIDYKRGGKALNLDGVYYGLSLQLPVYLAVAVKRVGAQSAGVYYFNLDEGILDLQTTDRYAVETERRKAFRLNGLSSDDMDVLNAASPDYDKVLNVRVTKSGALMKGTMATDQAGFRAMIDHALHEAQAHLDAMASGEAAIAPSQFRGQTPCAWCKWRPICLFDERLDASRVRRFPSLRSDEVMTRMKLEQRRP